MNMIKHEQDSKRQDVHDLLQVTTSKTNEIESRTIVMENKIEETSKTAKDYSGEMSNIKDQVKSEMDQLREEMRRRPAQIMMYPTQIEERTRRIFKGLKTENPVEFLLHCEREMELIGSALTDKERIDFFREHFQDCAARWYIIVRDNLTTYEQFKESFEGRYWNIHTQRQVRDQLEYGKYQHNGRFTLEEKVIQIVERSKHLRPTFTQHELVLKLAHHFQRDIRLGIYRQGIKTVEDLLILLTQSEHMFHTDYRNKTNVQDERRYAENSGGREFRREKRKVENKTEGSNTKGGYT